MLFAGLLDTLRRNGFTITVDHELRLQRLLPHLDETCRGPADLRDLLCPLFATSREEQESFGPIFEHWLRGAGVRSIEPKPPASQPRARFPWYNRPLLYLCLVAVLLMAVWLAVRRTPVPPPPPQLPPKVEQRTETIETPSGSIEQLVTVTSTYQQPPDWTLWWSNYRLWIYGGAATILLLWTLFEIWRYQRRRLVIQRDRQERLTAPHRLELKLPPHHAGLAQNTTLHEAARRLRRREVSSSSFAIDLPATIRETVRRAGFLPGFQLRQQTREPAYLMLIDRRSFRDHQMLLFEEFARALLQRNVDIAVFHFEGDPRYPVEAAWSQFRQRHGDDRLLLACDGESLRHPGTGKLADWVEREFAQWEQRALVTPVETERWGLREQELSRVFPLWSATAEEILALSRDWNGERVNRPVIRARWAPARVWRDVNGESVEGLRRDLGRTAFDWLCACAQYPELHWDLTLRLARIPEIAAAERKGPGEPDRLRLFSLDWFRQGFIPREWCERLAGELEPSVAQAARQAILEEIAQVRVAESSDAGQFQRLWVQFQKFWPGRGTFRGWWRLRSWARGNSPETLQRDVVVVRSLDSLRRSPIYLAAPEALSRWLHEMGISLLGLRTVFRFAAVGVTAMLLAVGIAAVEYRVRGFHPKEFRATTRAPLDDVYFDFNSTELRQDARDTLTRVAAVLAPAFQQDQGLTVLLEGHTAAKGNAVDDVLRSDQRATAVKGFLVNLGLPAARLRTISYGRERQQCSGSNADCQAREERVHFATVANTYVASVQVVKVPTSAGEIQETYALVPHGKFQMGCSPGDGECYDNERPVHEVTLSRDYYMAQTEVTSANYAKFVAHTKRQAPQKTEYSKTDQDPVVNVTWDDAQAYCAFVSGRLPTEAEWEYAARGGRPQARYGPLDSVAWYLDNAGFQLHPVDTKLPNAYGLYDMLGNAWEWAADWYGGYSGGAATDPTGPASGENRVVRGGGWFNLSRYARASYRFIYRPRDRNLYLGFRCIRPTR